MENRNNAVKLGRASLQKSILVVDDKLSFLKLTERLFRTEIRIGLHIANNSAGAFEKIRLNPDLVLMDLDLGDDEPTGIELVADFREQGFAGIIYMLTGNSNPKRLSEAFDAGANGYIVKCSSSEGSLKDQVTKLLFPEDNSPGGGGWPLLLRCSLPILKASK